ncbi:hypothetical protein CHS0354_003210 [Potamilus streckersoni]|uniref:NACHT domain-containing protein n=1 Tax=Potamilus streckersoni TaxID=2493646 RepID=A0AAE0SJ87_9BIVA|nr:hypothetical protein CHS0354_003210 [Potamilus streckersoni]
MIALQTQSQQLETDLKGQKSQMESYAQVISKLKTFIDNNPDLCKIKVAEELQASTDEINAVKSKLQTFESQFININSELSRIRIDQEAMETEVTNVKGEQEKIRVEHEVVKAHIIAVKHGQKTMMNQIENLEQNQREKQTEIQPSTLSTVDMERLQKDLFMCYKFLNVIPISPLHESYTTLLDDIFTSVIIERKDKENVGNLLEQMQPRISKEPIYLSSYHQLFGDKASKRLILTGFMGSGKTVFCKKVVQTWCWVKSGQVDPRSAGERALDGEDILSQFEFLFFIDLAKVSNQEDLLHVIHKQCSIPDDIENKSFLCKLLRNIPEKILIILDGLDEMGSQTPGFVNDLLERKLYPQIAVLVSTRPWQVSNLNLQLHSHYDLLLTVQGFDEKRALDFAIKVIHAHDKDVSDNLIKDMIASLTRKKTFATFSSVPLLLLFLINVWCRDRSLPDQYSELYSKIIDCMTERYLNKTKGKNLKWVEMSESKTKLMESSFFVKTFGNAFLELISKLSYELLLK